MARRGAYNPETEVHSVAAKLEKVQVPGAVLNGFEVAASVNFGMSDIKQGQLAVIHWLNTSGFPAAARWVEHNTDLFCRGLVAGFEKEGDPSCLKKLSDYTDEEKCEKFDELYRMAREDFAHVREHGYAPKDSKHWMFEAVMELLSGAEMWDAYNANME